jgi:hypothetical protein
MIKFYNFKTIFLIPVTALILFLLLCPCGCKNYNTVDLYPPCDTTNVTYSGSIHPIVVANCLPCHSLTNYNGFICLDNADSARIPAKDGRLIKAVTHDPSVIPMPKGDGKISDCDISKIWIWIRNGEPSKK